MPKYQTNQFGSRVINPKINEFSEEASTLGYKGEMAFTLVDGEREMVFNLAQVNYREGDLLDWTFTSKETADYVVIYND